MEGNYNETKYVVFVIATLTTDLGLKTLSILHGVKLIIFVVPSSFFSFQELF
jgi:hypothetical protein